MSRGGWYVGGEGGRVRGGGRELRPHRGLCAELGSGCWQGLAVVVGWPESAWPSGQPGRGKRNLCPVARGG
eukprot:365734-Chlamydomonas_euryale.AAC.15